MGKSLFTGGCRTNLALFHGASHARCLGLGTAGGIRGHSGRPGSFVSPWAHRAAVNTLSEIGKPGSGCTADFTSDGQEPIHREHITCSW
ncbi:hypothetical protein KTH81_06545 [Lachnospiraceae bacterium ASD3451]|nr:hypothetical protein [Diplocloster agilis]